jgi:hypothetical protein
VLSTHVNVPSARVLVGVLAPKDRVVPSLSEAQHAKLLSHLSLPIPQSCPEIAICLRGAPELKWVVKLIDLREFQPSIGEIFKGVDG